MAKSKKSLYPHLLYNLISPNFHIFNQFFTFPNLPTSPNFAPASVGVLHSQWPVPRLIQSFAPMKLQRCPCDDSACHRRRQPGGSWEVELAACCDFPSLTIGLFPLIRPACYILIHAFMTGGTFGCGWLIRKNKHQRNVWTLGSFFVCRREETTYRLLQTSIAGLENPPLFLMGICQEKDGVFWNHVFLCSCTRRVRR